jgi:hypothetical protein
LGGFAILAAMLLLKNMNYFTLSFIFSLPGDVSITTIAAPATKRGPVLLLATTLRCMYLCHPDPRFPWGKMRG